MDSNGAWFAALLGSEGMLAEIFFVDRNRNGAPVSRKHLRPEFIDLEQDRCLCPGRGSRKIVSLYPIENSQPC
jgi:hypothetical protein